MRAHGGWRLLEFLEARTLLDAVIQVSGNGATISNLDTTPSTTDFTDFGPMSTTFNAGIGRLTRTFTITNTGDTALTLTGTTPITLTGAGARDFTVTSAPSDTVDQFGGTTTFTVTFAPRAAGLRTATLNIASSDTNGTYSFVLQGLGVRTITTRDGLQISRGTGTGAAAINGAAISANFTGSTLNTGPFESTNGTPQIILLGAADTIEGLSEGLLGAKAGETRYLFMPSDLGFGTLTHGSVPANSPLIYQVGVVSVENPTAVVSGNGTAIAYRSKTPNSSDGTFIGATVAGDTTPLTTTFTVTNGNNGVVQFPKTPAVTITGSKNFTVSDLTIDANQTTGTFTVTYTPTKAGTQTAVVHVRTNDPVHPDFSFTVGATNTPFLELAPTAIGNIRIGRSGTIVSGATTRYTVPVTITNNGNSAVAKTTAPLQIILNFQDASSNNTMISTQSVKLAGLAAGRSRIVNMVVTVPGTVATGTYQPFVTINDNSAVPDINSSNNSFLGSQVLDVVQGSVNIAGTLGTSTFPDTLDTGQSLSGTLKVIVANSGTLPLPRGQTATIQVIARPDSGSDVMLGSSIVSISSLAAGGSKTFSVRTLSVLGLSAGHYTLIASITPVQTLDESSTSDNLATTTGSGGTLELTVSVPA
jgi:hypothetical protein